MNCRDFLTEFEERNNLTEPATLHLNDCADCRKINVVQTRVWQAIEAFERVDAPKDFDFRVKARIADAKPSDFQPNSFPVLHYVLGLSIAGLIFAFVVFNGVYSPDEKTVPQIAETNFIKPSIGIADPIMIPSAPKQIASATVPQSSSDKNLIDVVSKPKIALIGNKKESKTVEGETRFVAADSVKIPQVKSVREDEKNSVNSHDSALSTAQPLLPKNLNGNQSAAASANFDGATSITAEQILSQLGIETALENGKRQVKKISANSVGERSDVRVGDVIEAIDGEKLTSEPIRAKTIEGKNLTIMRGAEKLEISLHN